MTAMTGRDPPAVSVVLPVHNGAAFLAAALDSVLAQSVRDFECIVIDDGSTDATPAMLAEVARADARLRVVRIEHAGIVAGLNRGLAEARAPLIMRMDADDVALPDRMARQAAFLQAHPEVAVVGGAIELIDRAGRRLRRVAYPTDPAAIAAALPRGAPLAHPAVMMRRDAVRGCGGYRPQFQYAEDYDLWLRIAERAQIANLPEVVLRYRNHSQKLSVRRASQQAIVTLAAQVAAAARRAGRPDPFAAVAAIDADLLRRHGVPEAAFAKAQADQLVAACRGAIDDGDVDAALDNLRLAAALPRSLRTRTERRVMRRLARHYRAAGALGPWLRWRLLGALKVW
jgi:glycosyltransferase involved in cell wall biosynthesis